MRSMSGAPLSGHGRGRRATPARRWRATSRSAPAARARCIWLLGDAARPRRRARLVARHRASDFDERSPRRRRPVGRASSARSQVETPDQAFNAMVNHWLPYQSLACRIRARSAFYQASGAFGFRDQLQDTLALLLHDPSLARDADPQRRCAGSSPEGDVQHWWLPRTGAGVRTMISDDVVWLAYARRIATCTVTGDEAILDRAGYLHRGPSR